MTTIEAKTGYEAGLNEYVKQEKSAVELITAVGRLMYDKGVELVFYRNHLVDISTSELINLFDYAEKILNKPIDIHKVAEVAKALSKMDLAPSKLDIGKITNEYLTAKNQFSSVDDFLNTTLNNFIGAEKHNFSPQDVVLYGFGRIGRLAARELIKQAGKGQQLRLRAIVIRTVNETQIKKRAALLRNDSVHGAFKGSVIEDYHNQS